MQISWFKQGNPSDYRISSWLTLVIWLLFIGRLTLSIKATAEAATLAATVAHLIRFCLFAGSSLPFPRFSHKHTHTHTHNTRIHIFCNQLGGSENLPQSRQAHMHILHSNLVASHFWPLLLFINVDKSLCRLQSFFFPIFCLALSPSVCVCLCPALSLFFIRALACG